MTQHVLPEVEGLPAVAAAERLLPCVDPQVHLQVALRVVALPTDVTHPLAEMGLQVELQVLLGVELVPANAAELRGVSLSVIHQRDDGAESRSADLTRHLRAFW